MAACLMKGFTWEDAQKLVKGKPRFQYPIVVENKADEIRCQVKLVEYNAGQRCIEYLSYAGKPLHNLSMFTDDFLQFFRHSGYTELDVGIEVNGNFNDSYRWTQSSSGIPQEKLDKKTGKVSPALDVSMLKFIVFDIPEETEAFRHRVGRIDTAATELECVYDIPATRPVRRTCWNYNEVMSTYAEYRALGHEGAMGKTLDHLYERKRSFNWMKIKPKEFLDGIITGINRAHSLEGVPLDRAGSVAVRFEDGSTADCGGLKHAFAAAIYADPASVIGEWCECERMEADRAGGSRHPIFKRLREAKA